MTAILTVCTGNICRSPMAEAFLRTVALLAMGGRRLIARYKEADTVNSCDRVSRYGSFCVEEIAP